MREVFACRLLFSCLLPTSTCLRFLLETSWFIRFRFPFNPLLLPFPLLVVTFLREFDLFFSLSSSCSRLVLLDMGPFFGSYFVLCASKSSYSQSKIRLSILVRLRTTSIIVRDLSISLRIAKRSFRAFGKGLVDFFFCHNPSTLLNSKFEGQCAGQ